MDKIRNVIDLHCDTISECYQKRVSLKNDSLHLSLDRLPKDYALCQFVAVWIPDTLRGDAAAGHFEAVARFFANQVDELGSEISQVFDTGGIADALKQKRFAAALAIEGGAALAGKLENIEKFYNMGVRLITLTWNAENELCGGSATNSGFTAFGREAVREMERLKIAVDVSHLSDKGFWELCGFAGKPFIASHSNSRVICNHPRNITDGMFREIAERGGLVGLNYCKKFIREDGSNGSVKDMLKHVHHFLELGGEDSLALGSDYDGAELPDYLDGIEKMDAWARSLKDSGIPARVVDKIMFENADRYFKNLSSQPL